MPTITSSPSYTVPNKHGSHPLANTCTAPLYPMEQIRAKEPIPAYTQVQETMDEKMLPIFKQGKPKM